MIMEICKVFARKGAPLDAALDAVHEPYHRWSMAARSRWARSSSMEIPGNVRWRFGLSHLQEQGDRGSKEGVSAKHLQDFIGMYLSCLFSRSQLWSRRVSGY